MHSEDQNYFFERYSVAEWDGFRSNLSESRASKSIPRKENQLVIGLDKDHVVLGLHYDPRVGQPHRNNRDCAVTLGPGETARLYINGRHTSYSGQHYTETAYNVAFGPDLAARVFLDLEPKVVFDMRVSLF